MILLCDGKPSALVLSRSTAPPRAMDSIGLLDAITSGGLRTGLGSRPESSRGGAEVPKGLVSTVSVKQLMEESLIATQMSLVNTLTRRCLAEGSKLLFVADVMAALKKYGEPWKDIFLDQACIVNPTWVIAAPILCNGKHLGAIIWLSNTRLNPALLAQAAKLTVPPLLHCIAQQLQHFLDNPMSPVSVGPSSMSMMADDTPPLWQQVMNVCTVRTLDSAATTGPLASLYGSGVAGPGSGMTGELTDGGTDHKPIKYTVARTDSASTAALVRVYQTAITQHQRASASNIPESLYGSEEIEVIAKAGQGAFGSVYVAMWKGLVVAVKVMRQQTEGRRAMRIAWELAVTKSLSHPNVVMVYAVLTDVVVEKKSKRVIRFVPTVATLELLPGSPRPSTTTSMASGGLYSLDQADPKDLQPRCQVIIMEYCNLGPLHHFVAERRFLRQPLKSDGEEVECMDGDADAAAGTSAAPTTTPKEQPPPLSVPDQVDVPQVLITLCEVATAMQYLHSCGFIHCDLKPENILLKVAQSDGRGFVAKVSDFGLSELFTSEGPLMGELGGTVTHIAPEIVMHRRVTKACDVYAFGIIMWEVYTGQRPYAELLNSTRDKRVRDKTIVSRVAHENMRPVFPETAPRDYVSLAQRCWAGDPTARPTFPEVVNELRNMLDLSASGSCGHVGNSLLDMGRYMGSAHGSGMPYMPDMPLTEPESAGDAPAGPGSRNKRTPMTT